MENARTVPLWLLASIAVAALVIALAAVFTHQWLLNVSMLLVASLVGAQFVRARSRRD